MKIVKTFGLAAVMALALGIGRAEACEGSAKAHAATQTEQKTCPFTGKTAQQPVETRNVQFVTVSQQGEAASAKQCSQGCNMSSVVSAMALAFALVGGIGLGVRKMKA